MSDPSAVLPGPTPEDGEDVVLALETAATLWKRGDTPDAIRWLRRAAESAEEGGNDMRALALARTAAELTSAAERKASGGAADRPLVSRPADPDAMLAAALQTRGSQKPFPTPPPPPAAAVSRPPPPSSVASRPATAPGSEPRAAALPAERLPSPPAERRPPGSERPAPPPTGGAPAAAAPPAGPKSLPPAPRLPRAPATDALSELMRADSGPVKSKGTSPTALGALRVSVRRSPDDAQLLLVRLLGPEDSAPKGEKNAMLVATEIIIDQLIPAT